MPLNIREITNINDIVIILTLLAIGTPVEPMGLSLQ